MQESIKKLQKSSVILRALQEIFLHDIAASFRQVMMTVSHVYICDKTRIVKVYVSFMPSDQGEKMIKELDEQKSKIRGLLGKKLANKLRSIPVLKFYLDTSIERAVHIERLLNEFAVPLTNESIRTS